MGSLSPDASIVALWNAKHEVHLLRSDGKPIRKIGNYGASPLISHHGRIVAYLKLADESFDGNPQSYFEDAAGIAIYDLDTDQEALVTDGGGDDFSPVGFSLDMTKLFFNSTRAYGDAYPQNRIASLWVADLTNGRVRRLTNTDEREVQKGNMVPVITRDALWSADRQTIISSTGPEQGIWLFRLALDGGLINASKVGDGDSPQWLVPDESVIYRVVKNGRTEWRSMRIR